MNKEPLALYLLRIVIKLGFLAFLAMLYWSSLLLEERWRLVGGEVSQISNEVSAIHEQIDQLREIVQRTPPSPPPSSSPQSSVQPAAAPPPSASVLASRPHMDPAYPNLLQDDPFYGKILPDLLGPHFAARGTLRSATYGKPDHLHPFAPWGDVVEWWGLCSVSVARAKEGIYETYAPYMAIKMEERPLRGHPELPEYWVHLREGVFWLPLNPSDFLGITLAPSLLEKHLVTAHDFKFYFDAFMNPAVQQQQALALRNLYSEIEEFEVIDDLTFVVRWKVHKIAEKEGDKTIDRILYAAKGRTAGLAPFPRFVYQYFADGRKILADDSAKDIYRTSSVWGQNFNDHWSKRVIIGCGPYRFDGMSDRVIRFKRNPEFFFPLAALVERREVHIKNSSSAAWEELKAGDIDFHPLGDTNQRDEWDAFLRSTLYREQQQRGDGLRRLDYLDRMYTFIGWNMARQLFSSKRVRQALTMAIDRNRIIRQNLNGMGVMSVGSFFPGSPAADPSIAPWPFDPIRARHLLEAEGWADSQGDGILYKVVGGQLTPFRFRLSYFVKNLQTKAICEYIRSALHEVGIDCELGGVDIADLSALLDDKDFDAYFLAWGLGAPPEDHRQLWHSSGAKQKGSSNTGGFTNSEVDSIIDALDFASDAAERQKLYYRFNKIIHDEQPYTFLYIPKRTLAYREKVQNVFILSERQDLIPGANIPEPDPLLYWLKG